MRDMTMVDPASGSWDKLRPLLDQLLSELDESDRDVLALRFFEDRSFVEIGQLLRLTDEAARKRVGRALDRLHALLSRRGITSKAPTVTGTSTASACTWTKPSARIIANSSSNTQYR